MKEHVTVVPPDNLIIVDGEALLFDFAAPLGLHALQWRNGSGHTEWTGQGNRPLDQEVYAIEVLPFVTLWEEERARLHSEAVLNEAEAAQNKQPDPVLYIASDNVTLSEAEALYEAANAGGVAEAFIVGKLEL